MNDRFKFRVWDKYMQAYVENLAENCVWIEDDGQLGAGIDDDSCILEQCTGLKDKNGKLIYIGDIIKCGNGPLNTATVEYANGENFIDGIYPFNLYHDCGDECHCQLRDYPEYACEIIGNIHEQAEQKD